jgi:phospholipid/cholesterol/gamma-HCH transport system ATP-binding protein
MASLFRLTNVSLKFGSTEVFNSVNFEVQEGSSVVLVGPSGHGKSCLLKMLAGLQPPTSGTVLFEGQNLYELSFEERSELTQKMGMLFQRNALFDSLTVFENVAFPLREVKGWTDESQISERVGELLAAVGLDAAAPLMPHEISGGMQKRLGIARALILRPGIVLYDDPTAGLDPITSRHIAKLIMDLQKKNSATQVIVTNDMNRAFQISDHICMVVNGEVLVVGDREQALSHADPRVLQFVRGQTDGPLKAV